MPGSVITLQNAPQRDTSNSKTNNKEWRDPTARVFYRYLHSDQEYVPDTSLNTFHRRQFLQPWYRHLGNHGSPVYNLFFTPEYRVGPTLGYHVFDVYRFNVDSLKYYNTNRPYSVFTYQLGSKQEQTAQVMHTQNILPNWNFAAQYRKLTSPGTYLIQRTNHDNASFNTHYQSPKLHYTIFAGFVYNKEQNDENGGLVNEDHLTDSSFSDRRTIRVRFQNDNFGAINANLRRSSVSNVMRDLSVLIQHSYNFGRIDTIYSEDSTRYAFVLTPRFGLTHRFKYINEKHEYKDLRPDSAKYAEFFRAGFAQNDSVFSRQRWSSLDNSFALNGFLGSAQNPLSFSAGIGIRTDKFTTGDSSYSVSDNIFSNYLTGEIKKELRDTNQWYYSANAILYLTGSAAGNSLLQAKIGKELKSGILGLEAGFRQQLGDAPYTYTYYHNKFDTIRRDYAMESITQLYGTLFSERYKASLSVRNQLISNYIYINQQQQFDQYTSAFNLSQLSFRKMFVWRALVLDNELVYQLPTSGAPVNVPALMGRHQFSTETYIFGNALKIATGIEARYHSPYKPAGYSPYFNRFYYQDTYSLTNTPEASVFFNFKIKSFRAYFMLDQAQRLIYKKNIINFPGYPNPDMMIRFGFNWVLIN
jgi:hypothetical protein